MKKKTKVRRTFVNVRRPFEIFEETRRTFRMCGDLLLQVLKFWVSLPENCTACRLVFGLQNIKGLIIVTNQSPAAAQKTFDVL